MSEIGDFKNMVGALVGAQDKATTASASGELDEALVCYVRAIQEATVPDNERVRLARQEIIDLFRRAPAPSRNAAPLPNFRINRWSDTKQRGVLVIFDRKITDDELQAVRAALTQQSAAHDLNRNADWQNGYKTGYETGLGDGRAEFTNPAATSPAERAEPDMLEAFDDWMKRRGALGAGAMPERIFFAGWLAARRAAPVAQLDADLPPPEVSKKEVDYFVYKCRQAGTDTTYDIVNAVVAPYVERIRHLERNQLPKLEADDEVSYPNDSGLAVVRAERYDQLRAAEERVRHLEREHAERKPATSIGGDPEFCALLGKYSESVDKGGYRRESDEEEFIEARGNLITYIDGRTAAPTKVIDSFTMDSGHTVHREARGNGYEWVLRHADGSAVRGLDKYESDFVASALRAGLACGRTAGTASEAAPELIEIGNRMATTLEVLACALKNPGTAEGVRRTVEEWRAAAPSTQEGAKP